MPGFLSNLLRLLRERRGTDMDFLCHHLLSERGEASQTVLAQEIIKAYNAMNSAQRRGFLEMLSRGFGPDEAAIVRAAADYKRTLVAALVKRAIGIAARRARGERVEAGHEYAGR